MKHYFLQNSYRFSGLLIASLLIINSCGKVTENYSTQRGASALSKNQVALEVRSDTVKTGTTTAVRMHILDSRLLLSTDLREALDQSSSRVLVHLSLKDDTETITFEQTKSVDPKNLEAKWKLPISTFDGLYKVTLEILDPQKILPQPVTPWIARVELDTTPPQLAVDASFGPANDAGQKPISISVLVENERDVTCDPVRIEQFGIKETLTAPLKEKFIDETSLLARQFLSEITAPNMQSPGQTTASIRCKDGAGNESQLVQTILAKGNRALSIKAQAIGPRGQAVGANASPELVAFTRPGSLKINIDLIDAQTTTKLSEPAIAAERLALRLYVTEKQALNIDELLSAGGILAASPTYVPELNVLLPGDYIGQKNLFVSLVRLDIDTNDQLLLATQILPIYVDNSPPQLVLMNHDKPKFTSLSAAQNPGLIAEVKTTVDGAPLASAVNLQYSIDGKNWIPVTIKTRVEDPQDPMTSDLSFNYPLMQEADFRVRAIATDLLGQSSSSPISRQWIGRTGIPAPAPITERNKCQSMSDPAVGGYLLEPALASSFLCKKAEITGALGGQNYARVLLQNQGRLLPAYYTTTVISAGMGYKIIVTEANITSTVLSSRYSQTGLFDISPSGQTLLHVPLLEEWLTLGKKVEIKFDNENSDAYSTTNNCYANNSFPTVLIKEAGSTMATSAFACDEDMNLFP